MISSAALATFQRLEAAFAPRRCRLEANEDADGGANLVVVLSTYADIGYVDIEADGSVSAWSHGWMDAIINPDPHHPQLCYSID